MADKRKRLDELTPLDLTALVNDPVSRFWQRVRDLEGEAIPEARVTQLLDAELALLRLRIQLKAEPLPALPPLYPLQRELVQQARRFNVLCIGRRAGKTYLGIWLALSKALRGQPVGWFAPSYKFVLEVWRDMLRWALPVATRINSQERRIEFAGGGVIEFWSLENKRAGQGRKYALAIIDEAATAIDLGTLWNQAIRPTLTDLRGSAWFLSTPQGLNYFFEAYRFGQDDKLPLWQSWQYPSSVNPFLPPGEIETMRGDMPEMDFRQEYLAEFIRGEGAVFRNITACLHALPGVPAQHDGHQVVIGGDWGKNRDFTVFSVYCASCRAEVELERFNQIGWQLQRDRLETLIQKWSPGLVLLESNSIGEVQLEELAASGLPVRGFLTTAASKGPLIRRLALAFEKTAAQWLPDSVAKLELEAFEARQSPLTGFVQYSAPEGGHDDTVIGRALAYVAGGLPEVLSSAAVERAFSQSKVEPLFQ